ncbi:hypothetical protein [Saccharicrinis fermentans]|uniref:Glycoside hydrolase family 5 domain-containing protein n=1 Tax=Saccharicrinis fermentans DSM 9555 = JCM 21142 TaxID=869213 RepID=W7Y1S6_9BACT|nr:hypothetical protein [Saccharicrinis fermentans]GAF01473.1 hypothetical protein JCM21142_81 [Saccharicrinis fermentans DSM 9555 = JCM 21142]
MKKVLIFIGLLSLVLSVSACDSEDRGVPENVMKNRVINITSEVISTDYVGNGAQWGGYESTQDWIGSETLSDEDWNTLYQRIDFMRPPFLRIMVNASSYISEGVYNETANSSSLFKMLDYAQSRDIEIAYGEWGHHYSNNNLQDIDLDWISQSVKFLNFLVNEKGYSCIKTVNIINEPNGEWSSAKGDYTAWKNAQSAYLAEMDKYSGLSAVQLMGPDIAIFNSVSGIDWITNAHHDFDESIGLYDIHVYPKQLIVRNGDYTEMLKAYRDVVPNEKKIVLSEIGFKYDEVDYELKEANDRAIANDPYAGDDSNMMIYESFYGTDMADAIMQSMLAGFSGGLVWDMDDAMYVSPDGNNYNVDKMKRWGFWNILGEEHVGDAADEEIRPFFYPVSLLCRYFPAGTTIYNVEFANKKGVRAVMGEKDGKYTIAIVNSHYVDYEVELKSDFLPKVTLNKYCYEVEEGQAFIGVVDADGFAVPVEENVVIDFSKGLDMTLKGESFILYTNME